MSIDRGKKSTLFTSNVFNSLYGLYIRRPHPNFEFKKIEIVD